MLLYIVRHGDPIYNPDSLTEKGIKQSEALAKRFSKNGLDKIYSSPLNRAKLTAKPTCDALGIECKIEGWMAENLAYDDFCYIDKTGKNHGWIFFRHRAELLNNQTIGLGEKWYDADCFSEDSERFKNGYKRICDESDVFFERLGYRRSGVVYEIIKPSEERVAVFCHQGFGVTWLSHILNIPPHIFWAEFDITHSSVTVIDFRNFENGITVPKCLQLSDVSHILADGLPFEYNNNIKL